MRNLLIFIFLFSALGLSAQYDAPASGSISGKVLDAGNGTPLDFATVSVLDASDSTLVTGGTTEQSGTFLIEKVPFGKYYLEVSFIGYQATQTEVFTLSKTQKVKVFKTIEIGAGTTLEEVVVTGQKSLIETRLDKRVFNASADMSSQGGTGLTLLSNVPGVEVDIDNNISLRGNGNVQILINGRPSTLSPATFLQQVPATSIERIEIITNPSAKYDPEGTAGILNIILKEQDQVGFNGNVNMAYRQGISPRYNGSVGLNYRSGKWNTFGTYSYSDNQYTRNGTNFREYEYTDTSFVIDQYDEGLRGRSGHNIRMGTDYFLNKQNTLYFSGNFQTGDNTGDRLVNYDFYDQNADLSRRSERLTDAVEESNEFNINTGWQHKFLNPEHKLDIDLNYAYERELDDDFFNENAFDKNGNSMGLPLVQHNRTRELEGVFTGMVDYVLPLENNGRFEAGWRTDVTHLDNDFFSETYNFIEEQYENDDELINRFFFVEQVHAAYATYGREFGKFSLQAGLRGEQTFTQGRLEGSEPIDRSYFRLFPSMATSYKFSDATEMLLSYSRRINRPRPWQLNPFTNFSDPLNLRQGNPYLLPEDIHSFEWGIIQFIGDLTLNASVYHRITNDVRQRFIRVDENSGVSTRTFENIGQSTDWGSELIVNYAPWKWWSLNATVNVFYNVLTRVEQAGIDNLKNFGYSLNYNSQFKFKNGWSAQINGRYRAPRDIPQGRIRAFYFTNLAVRKSFMDDKLNIGLSARDVFNTMQWSYSTTQQSGLTQDVVREWESQVFGIDFNYTFGNMDNDRKNKNRNRSSDFGGGEMD
jgi:outer membrane receptor protein involved in Fe transport